MFYHINTFKQAANKKYQLDFALEGDLDMIKEWLEESAIMRLSIKEVREGELEKIGSIQAEVYNTKNNTTHKLITHHENIAQACLLLVFLGFDVRNITDLKKPLSSEQSTKLITLVHQKINEQKAEKIKEEEGEEENIEEIEDERVTKIKEIAAEVHRDIDELIQRAQDHTSKTIIRELREKQEILQKYSRGTNRNKISGTLKIIFGMMEEIELHMIEESKEEEIHLTKNSLISNIDILNEYNKRQKAEHIKSVGETSTDSDDKYYQFFGKIGIYTRFLKKEFLHKLAKGNFTTKAITKIIDYISLLLPIIYGFIILISKGSETLNRHLLIVSYIAVYASLRNIRSAITKQKNTLTLLGIPLVIGVGYILSLLIYNTFAL